MKEIEFSNPSETELTYLSTQLFIRRKKYYTGGINIGFLSIGFAIVTFITIIINKWTYNDFANIILALLLSIGISAIIGACRCIKEANLYLKGDFVIQKGVIEKVEKRNFWSDKITILINEKPTIISTIGHSYKNGDKVYITIVNKDKAKWAIPKITKYEGDI
jgi:hypothetical protein